MMERHTATLAYQAWYRDSKTVFFKILIFFIKFLFFIFQIVLIC
jgi:hypothetical protein